MELPHRMEIVERMQRVLDSEPHIAKPVMIKPSPKPLVLVTLKKHDWCPVQSIAALGSV